MANRTCSPIDLRARFNARVDAPTPDGCWPWLGGKTQGYGVFSLGEGGRKMRAHRFAYETFVGPIPSGMLVDHACRNRSCVNPSHLRLVNRVQNAQNVERTRINSRSGERGVFWDVRRRKWITYADLRGRRTYGPTFDDPDAFDEAVRAARDLRNQLHTHNDIDRIA